VCVCVCVSLCTTVVHNTAQSDSDNLPSYPPHSHHCSDVLYLGHRVTDRRLPVQNAFTRIQTTPAVWNSLADKVLKSINVFQSHLKSFMHLLLSTAQNDKDDDDVHAADDNHTANHLLLLLLLLSLPAV